MSVEWPDGSLEIEPRAVESMLADASTEFLLLDCRTAEESAIASIGGTLLPMQELPERISELEDHAGSRVVVYCHSGRRSLMVTQFLLRSGFASVCSMRGGIEAWSLEIDPTVPRY